MEEPRARAANLQAYRRALREGWRLVDVDSTDQEVILTLRKGPHSMLLPLGQYEAAKLAGFDDLAARARLKEILGKRKV